MRNNTTTDPTQAPNAETQRQRLLRLLVDARGSWVPLPEILKLRIAQYSARIFELRRAGYRIENRTETIDGERHSQFRLVEAPADQAILSIKEQADGRERRAGGTRHSRAEQFSREFGVRHPWKTAFSEKRLADPDCFTLKPPEPKP